ncbi:hypothetical protein G3I35_22985, partial [Streptomyces sp. SID10815]|nr:hypothetical protein [Streptomyces sp. SID10815]
MSQQGGRPTGHEDDWWRQLYDDSTADTGPTAAADSLDDRFASAADALDGAEGAPPPETAPPDRLPVTDAAARPDGRGDEPGEVRAGDGRAGEGRGGDGAADGRGSDGRVGDGRADDERGPDERGRDEEWYSFGERPSSAAPEPAVPEPRTAGRTPEQAAASRAAEPSA